MFLSRQQRCQGTALDRYLRRLLIVFFPSKVILESKCQNPSFLWFVPLKTKITMKNQHVLYIGNTSSKCVFFHSWFWPFLNTSWKWIVKVNMFPSKNMCRSFPHCCRVLPQRILITSYGQVIALGPPPNSGPTFPSYHTTPISQNPLKYGKRKWEVGPAIGVLWRNPAKRITIQSK